MEVGMQAAPGLNSPPVCGTPPFIRCRRLLTDSIRDADVMKRVKGFSLIELLVAVAIVGILAAIALPSYQYAVIKGRRGNAQSFMLDVAQREQQLFVDSRAYVAVADNAGLAGINLTVPQDVGKYYDLKVELSGPPPGFTITATPKGSQASDGALTMDSNGSKTPADKW